MNITIENILLIGSLLLFISIVVGKTSYRFGVPTLILFLSIGMLAGSEGIGGINFNNPQIAQFIGIVSLNFILFSGGLDTQWFSIKPIVKEGILLSTIGVFITAISFGLFVFYITDFTIYESLLLGSIVSSTDAAAVFSILRSKNLALKSNIRPTLEFESGSNDPMAYVLTISFLNLVVNQNKSFFEIIPLFVTQMLLGAIAGVLFGKLIKYIINHIRLSYEGLYPILVISLMFITFSFTDFVGGNGFLAIYLSAIYLGNQDVIHKMSIYKMYDGLAWLMQIVLFLTLGLLVFPSNVLPYFSIGLVVSLFLIFISRPISVFISTAFIKKMGIRKKLYISWVGLRGAVPIVFATYPLIAGIEKSSVIFNIVFFISVTSLLIQGTTLGVVAKWLKVGLPEDSSNTSNVEKLILDYPKSSSKEFKILPHYASVGKRIVELNLLKSVFIVMIKRDKEFIKPNGSTVLESGDTLVVIADNQNEFNTFSQCLE